jgi:RNA polymerase sigma-70 factor (ECF subfamily)
MTEQAIIAGCLQNDAAAQRELYNRFSPKMLSVCYRFYPDTYIPEQRRF